MAASRRAFLAGFGGGLATAALAWTAWEHLPWRRPATQAHPVADYVDYDGWILTKADKERLTASGSITRLEATTLEGPTLNAAEVVPDVESCAVWCLSDPNCQGFTFGKADHLCALKGTSELRQSPNPMVTSGIR